MYQSSSVAEKGTLYQLKQRFDGRNVRKEVNDLVHPSRVFLNFVTYGYTVLAVMDELELEAKNYHCRTYEEKTEYLDSVAMHTVTKLVLLNGETPKRHYEQHQQETEKKKSRFQCGFHGCL